MVQIATGNAPRHVPVMLGEVMAALDPRDGGIYVDGTFGAGGYTRGLLAAADCRVFAIDRDPRAIAGGAALVAASEGRLTLIEDRFGGMDDLLASLGVSLVDGIALDIGVSSMQLDEAERGFSFTRDGPLDMRMESTGPSAADVVNTLDQAALARIVAVYGEERRARAIAAAIVRARPIGSTAALAAVVERTLGAPRKPHAAHPATRVFQALRIHVNGELGELAKALGAAERMLRPGGRLAVVTFHSLEDRIVKHFLNLRGPDAPRGSRHLPDGGSQLPQSFEPLFRGHREASPEEVARNPRARSAKLRAARRTSAPAGPRGLSLVGLPSLAEETA